MTQSLREIAQQLSSPKVINKTITKETRQIAPKEVEESKPVPKVQLIYAFNGTGKTRLSREFKEFVAPKSDYDDDRERSPRDKILYYNAFTEDLFYWNNDLEADAIPELNIQPNSFTHWVLNDQGQDRNIIDNFQRYTNDKLTPKFLPSMDKVHFSLERGDDEPINHIKISKGEESLFVWSVFFTLLEQVISVLNVAEIEERETNQFDELEYVFIDDPVSSLDENHLIELAVNIASLLKSSESGLKFVITTHNPLFYNVLYSELNNKACYLLESAEDGSHKLIEKHGASNHSFSYHLYLKETIETAIAENRIEKYHFMLLRNLYEKTANFLGYREWPDLLNTVEGDKEAYLKRIIHFTSHRTFSGEEIAEPTNPEKQIVKLLLDNLRDNYGFKKDQQGT